MSGRDLRLDAAWIKVLSLQSSKEQTEEGLKDRRLFYVGCSRAMTHLSVFTRPGQESELLDDLQPEHWDTVQTA